MKTVQVSKSKDWIVRLLTKPSRRLLGCLLHTPKPTPTCRLPRNTCDLRKAFLGNMLTDK